MNFKQKSVLFVTFSMWDKGKRMPTNGNLEPFRDYLLSRGVKHLILIDQPVPSSVRVMPVVEEYSDGKEIVKTKQSSWWMYIFFPFLRLFNKQGTRLFF
jgi:hypothetical protein